MSMEKITAHLHRNAERYRFSLAVALGIGGAILTANSGIGAGGAYFLSLIFGSGFMIFFGGDNRLFHTGIFGVALVAPLLLISRSGTSGVEMMMILGISIGLPMTLAHVVTRYYKRSIE